jgi:hypothetical protein
MRFEATTLSLELKKSNLKSDFYLFQQRLKTSYVEAEGRSGEREGIRHARELSWSEFPFRVLN